MAGDLNLCQFIGRLGRDPELSYMPNGNAVCKISIAVGEHWKDQSGQKQERTTWVPIVAFGKLAEVMGQYLTKGSRIYVSGKMQVRKWQAQDGSDRWSTEIVASEMQMLDSKESSGPAGAGHQSGAQGSAPPPSNPGRDAGRGSQAADYRADQEGSGGAGGFGDFDSDLPFAPFGRELLV